MKLTKRKIKALIKDEKMATKEYKLLGLHNLSKDEHKHRLFLQKLQKKKCYKHKTRKYRKNEYRQMFNAFGFKW
jgi:hypothetical protein